MVTDEILERTSNNVAGMRSRQILATVVSSILSLTGMGNSIPVANAGNLSPVKPRDCVQVRYLPFGSKGTIKIDAIHKRVAYLVRVPEIAKNSKDIQLRLVSYGATSSAPDRILLEQEDVADPEWDVDGGKVTVLARIEGRIVLLQVDASNGRRNIIARLPDSDIASYSLNSAGTRVFLTGSDGRGYVTSRNEGGAWGRPARLQLRNPLDGRKLKLVPHLESMSPDGKQVALTIEIPLNQLPESWKVDPRIKTAFQRGWFGVWTQLILDLRSKDIRMPFPTIMAGSPAVWSLDSRSYVINAAPPVNSEWGRRDFLNGHGDAGDSGLYWVEPGAGKTEQIMDKMPDDSSGPLSFGTHGEVLVHDATRTIGTYVRRAAGWVAAKHVSIPFPKALRYSVSLLTSKGDIVAGSYQTPSAPPQLVIFDIDGNNPRVLTDLNPTFKTKQLAVPEMVYWRTGDGARYQGLLFKPINYAAGQKYPLIIQTKGNQGWFACDSGENHEPSFIPQPAASAGMMYLIKYTPENDSYAAGVAMRPKNLPGNVGETVQLMNQWDSAVSMLTARGLVDRDRVGIIGFSHTGHQVEYDLAHAKTHYAAATTADSIDYSYGEYAMTDNPDVRRGIAAMFGGPPAGPTLKNWLAHSVSFNMDKIYTPLLIELMGYGETNDDPKRPPIGVLQKREILNGLKALGRPVEYYYYEKEDHRPDGTTDRLMTLQRNLDWYRFWLQGYEDRAPEKSQQYRRWEGLCDMQVALKTSRPTFCVPTKH